MTSEGYDERHGIPAPSSGVHHQAIIPAAPSASGFYVQFGAYSQASNAEAVRTRLVQSWPSDLPPLEIVEYGQLFRLYSGPFATRADAAMAALRLQGVSASKPMIVQR